MKLHDHDIEAYVAFVKPDSTDAERTEQVRRLRAAVETGTAKLSNIRVARAANGDLIARLRLSPLGETSATLSRPLGDTAAGAGLVREAMEQAMQDGLTSVTARPLVDQLSPAFHEALLDAGFRDLGERIEFKSPIADLPGDDGSPLSWKHMGEIGRDAATAALSVAAEDGPGGQEERETPAGALADWLSDPTLTNTPACVQVGYLDDEPVAFLCAQVAPKDGWSRITHMGLAPDARGRGLGTWVHRHGFEMMRTQGGKLYHGGTSASNRPMLRLFEKHGCTLYLHMRAYEWNRPGA